MVPRSRPRQAERRSEQPGGTGQPGPNIEHAIFGPNLREFLQVE